VKFIAAIAMTDPSFIVPMARAAEDAGYDVIAVPDSIAYPRESESTYPYTPDGSREFLEHKPLVEPLIAIATMAAVTDRIRFVTNVLKLPIRHPVILAKEVTTLAVLASERVALGVGSSPWPDDYEIVELPWARRGRRFDECIEIIRGLATGDYFEFDGEHYRFPAIKLNPTPRAPIPILIGGHGEANLERAGRIGDGWISAGMSEEQLTATLARLQERREEYGRADAPFEIHAVTIDSFTADGIKRLEEQGVTHTMGGFSAANPYSREADTEPLHAKLDALRRYADDVIAKATQ
jgi:probable F420-dependent oxidoreductase